MRSRSVATRPADPGGIEREVEVGSLRQAGRLTVPADALGTVVFAHGSGSSRHSPRDRIVAEVLNEAGFGTLLFDMLTVDERLHRDAGFDIELFADRLVDATAWLRGQYPAAAGGPIGFYGGGTGATAALWAAAESGVDVCAVVSRGGRPDLARPRLPAVIAPTLLIVGGRDRAVLELNREAQVLLRCENRLVVVRDADQAFDQPAALHRAAALARDWFVDHLGVERLW